MTTTTTTTRQPGGLTPLAKGLITTAMLVSAGFATRHFVPGLFGGKQSTAAPASVPPKADLSSVVSTVPPPSPVPTVTPPTSDKAGCPDVPETRMLIWAWNAQQGLLFANGGPEATEGSLMCKNGVHLKLIRQDMVDQMQAELIKCAGELAKGHADCTTGAHFAAIMGDGSAAFFAAINPALTRVCPDCTAEVIGSAGYSRGEDKFMGPMAWKQHPAASAGGLVAGYLRDGDWNIAMKWAGDNAICNNPDETTYDPSCLNWVAASDYIDAGAKYIAGACEDRPVVTSGKRTGKTAHVCVNGVVTWTPGDVNVAQGKGGLVSIASTKEYIYQMPNVIIGLRRWDRAHRAQVTGLLRAMTDGGQQVKQSPAARQRAAEISATVYAEKDAVYWAKYMEVVNDKDKLGQIVELGGSSVNNLADNLHLFGLGADGRGVQKSIFAATYTVFGNIVVHYYPALVPAYPKLETIVDTSYLQELAAQAPVVVPAEIPAYTAADPVNDAAKEVVGRKNWEINFESGSDRFTPDATKVLGELYDQTVVTRTIVEINGHTDADGDAEANRELSRRRALAVRDYMAQRSPVSFPLSRFRVMGFGEDSPIAPNDSAANKAKNRRVELVMRAK
ncbi:MAG TPA: OmpA family protein [Kofleriaceae bacterium]|jgi:outer membrane protein OmpA-like peptidoglycan-associated protein|nr:OmpA family protein [Kofleriaceae bacterium]